MSKRFFRFVFFIFIVSILGCKTKKAIQQPVTNIPAIAKPNRNAYFVKQVKSSENNFEYYSAKGEAEYKDAMTEQSLNVSIVMEKDKYMWMSVTAMFGIEVARIKLTPDSLIMLDRLHRKCIVSDYSYIKKMADADLNLRNLQQLIIGNPAFDVNEKTSICDTSLTGLIIYTLIGNHKQSSEYNTSFRLQKNTIENRTVSKQLVIEYSNLQKFGTNDIPSRLTINIRAEKNVACKFTLTNFVFEKKKDVQFNIPANYEIVKP